MKILFKYPLYLFALLVVSSHVSADTFGSGANTFTLDFVEIGAPR